MFHRIFQIAVPLTLLVAGCGEIEPLGEGQLSLTWQVSPTGCDEAGVDVVELRLSGPDTLVERYACTRGGLHLANVDAGLYELELSGHDSNGKAIFEAEPRPVTVESGRTATVGTMRLVAKPAAADVGWVFSNGRVCGANGVNHIVVAIFDDQDYEVARERFPCDSGRGRISGLRAGAYLVEATGLTESTATWRGTEPLKASRGDELAVEIELTSVD